LRMLRQHDDETIVAGETAATSEAGRLPA